MLKMMSILRKKKEKSENLLYKAHFSTMSNMLVIYRKSFIGLFQICSA